MGRKADGTKSLRRGSDKASGGQLGHRGETLRLVAVPDAVVEHRPTVCSACHRVLDNAPVVLRERRQVSELPAVRLVVREHQALHVRCPGCQAVSVGTFPAEAPSRAQYGPRLRALCVYLVEQQWVPYARVRDLLSDVFGARLSEGTLVAWVQQSAATLAPVDAALKAALVRAPVLHNDETGVRRGGSLAWAHVASTRQFDPLCHPRQARWRGDRGHWHPAALHGSQPARRVEAIERLPPVPPTALEYSSPPRID